MTAKAPQAGANDPLSIHGVVPPTVTAFHDDESVNLEATAAHARFVVDGGAHGVFPLGTNGEFPLLSGAERDAVVEAVVDEVGEAVSVIAGVGAPSTHQTIARAEAAADAGADGLVVVTPFYYPLDHDAAVTHYERVARATDLPVYCYHIPSKTGNALSLDTLDDLAEIPNFAGVKDSSKDVPWLGQAIDAHPELTFLSGSDSLLYPGLSIGCSGMVSAVANVFPGLVVDLYDAFVAGDVDRARERQSEVYEVRDALKRGPYMAGVKTALSLRDVEFDVGPLRDPLSLMDDADAAELEADLTALGLL
ncbi:dihydrodipicolinate synthase family protein [Haloarculaceae archaeon H-GB2-1]|nr:dihydrodipicolinate synthase family protein [Haloarculaceae archaeon H-GB1-1]MEA5386558.1 dihydrodipicolinate synthase family protein [Haloarculaceae archaeon H-GB11]MEA5408070.1 dihydrodipicolinate synthase family protein [Haloarculaceae archaeon H-GB2-1]